MADATERRLAALTSLALATREKADRATYVLYLDGLADFSTDVVVRACTRLAHSAEWFPKLSQVREECRVVARYEQEQREQAKRRQLDVPQVSEERVKQLKADVAAFLKTRGMR